MDFKGISLKIKQMFSGKLETSVCNYSSSYNVRTSLDGIFGRLEAKVGRYVQEAFGLYSKPM